MDKELTVTKMTKNNSKCPKESLLKLSVQAQKFEISMKKASLGIRSPWPELLIGTQFGQNNNSIKKIYVCTPIIRTEKKFW